jgi:cytochrome c
MRLVGPSLWGVYGRKAGAVDGYDYSRPLRNAPLVWDDETLDAFLERPQAVIPNNRMSYGGENDAEKRRAIVEYLKTLK